MQPSSVCALCALSLACFSLPARAGALDALSERDMVRGLKDALVLGAGKAVNRLAKVDGFLLNERVRIPLPESLARLDSTLRQFGMGRYADNLVTTMNRAAEAAVPEAKTLLIDAVQRMSIDDAKEILTGGDDAATRYFRRQTQSALSARFLPVVQRATKKVHLAETYNQFAGKGVRFGLVRAEEANLDEYVTRLALDGLYATIAEEERAIRANPWQQSQKLLRKVFGSVLD
jgi:Protein of unknown function (DUF4197)